jgi:hypothetical protein
MNQQAFELIQIEPVYGHLSRENSMPEVLRRNDADAVNTQVVVRG